MNNNCVPLQCNPVASGASWAPYAVQLGAQAWGSWYVVKNPMLAEIVDHTRELMGEPSTDITVEARWYLGQAAEFAFASQEDLLVFVMQWRDHPHQPQMFAMETIHVTAKTRVLSCIFNVERPKTPGTAT